MGQQELEKEGQIKYSIVPIGAEKDLHLTQQLTMIVRKHQKFKNDC